MVRGREGTGRGVPHCIRKADAVFLGWQRTESGEVLALYNVTAAGHPSLGSTVTDKGLLKLNLHVPQTPHRPGGEAALTVGQGGTIVRPREQ